MSQLIEEILTGVYLLRLGAVNAYLIRRAGEAVLVDAGLPHHGRRIALALGELGLRPAGLRALLVTHRHLDHVGGAAALRDAGLPEVVAHEADAAGIDGRERLTPVRGRLRRLWLEPLVAFSDRRLFRYRPVPVRAASEGLRVGGLELLHLPGHTPGHCGYSLAGERVVFAGDAAMNLGGRLRGPSAPFSLDPEAVRRSQLRLAELEAELYCFGHGPPLERGAAALRALAGWRR